MMGVEAVHVLPQPTSLNQVVLDLIDLYQPAFAQKRLASGLDLDPALPLAWIDAPQLERGLASLLRNSVRSTRDGGLVFCRTTADGEWLELTIGDSGPRMSAEQAEGLFSPPGRADAAAATDNSAPGFDVSRAIIAAHGGEIRFDTSRDNGAWFVVRLPVLALENARLVAELERGSRLTYELLATLSYELRTPLNVIVGYTDLLLDGAFGHLGDGQIDALRRIDQAARDLLALINGSLDPNRHKSHGAPALTDALSAEQLVLRNAQPAGLASLAHENGRLIEALRQVKRAECEFVTTISHQLRVPLTALIGYTDLLLDEEFGPLSLEQAGVLQRVRRSSLHLLEALSSNLYASQRDH
ncbi:MAG: hypothetical protein HY699_19540 [Deltaproteobacteria bacterium]|nr:hypothetical protein [Deltaproteobacteria bacterium]